MPRNLREQYEGAFYHIISRGNEKKDIFYDEWDYKKFLEELKNYVCKYEINIFAYCLMKNHIHLLIQTKNKNLSQFMQRLLGDYASYFNKRHDRTGHLFGGRFKSYLVQDEKYLFELTRYIHLNPIRANLIKKPELYSWSSLKFYLNTQKSDFIKKDLILKSFDNIEHYYKFLIGV